MTFHMPARVNAFGLHLLFSAGVAVFSAAVVFWVWYPGVLAFVCGVQDIFLLLLAVDVILGPVITLIIFNQKKKELKRDLMFVVFVQLIAILYGLHAVYIARPVYIAFTLAQFDVVSANEISSEHRAEAKYPEYQSLPLWGPKIIAAPLPEDIKKREELVIGAIMGSSADVQQMPLYYLPYESQKNQVLKSMQPLDRLKLYNKDDHEKVDELIKKYIALNAEVGYLPVKGKVNDVVAVVSSATGEVIEMVELTP